VATTRRIHRHLFAHRTDQLVDALDALYVEAQKEVVTASSVVRPLPGRRKAQRSGAHCLERTGSKIAAGP
jgi:hypothetical protein